MTEISVPKGGGALTGIGETFQPDLHTGTGNLTVPVPLPPGRGSLTPTLALTYSSASGNGPLGLGWTLTAPRVSRRTDRGVPLYDDNADVFVLSGAEELVPVPLGTGVPADLPADAVLTRYRPRTEAGFARILHVVGPGQDYWDVWARTGLRSRYGTPRPPDAPADWTDPAAVRTPEGRVFSWLLSSTIDPFGNSVRYGYRGDGGAQRYLDTVSYADFGDPAAPSYAVAVRVTYSDATSPRPDPFSDRRPGFELRTNLRVRRISVSTVGDGGAPPTVVDLRYVDEGPGPAPAGGLSLLASIQVTGQDAATGRTESLPPLELGYRPWDPAARRFRRLPATLPPAPLGPGLELVDLFGDGLPSVLQLDGSARYWRNRGDGRIDAARPLRSAPSGATLGTPGVTLADIDADGRPELTVTADDRTTVWPLATPAPGSDQAGFVTRPRVTRPVPGVEPGSPQVRLVDLDGDHVPDLLLAGGAPLLAHGNGRGGFGRLRRVQGTPPLADLTDPHVQLADMTGDGLTDVVEVYDGAVRYWPSLGRGRFGPPMRMTESPRFRDAGADVALRFDPRRLLLGDVTGDGAADVVYVGDGSVTVWVNRSGNGFAPPVIVRGTPTVDGRSAVRLADIDGIGVSGVLWSGLGRQGEWAFLDLTGGSKPHLLTDIDNHRGAVTTLTWSTSTVYATTARLAGRPWRTPLPFPVHVVASSRTLDHFAQTVLTTGFHYADGYWDPVDREFRGFGRVEQTDTLTPAQPAAPPPALLTPLDPLTPAAPVPAGFDAALQGNLLRNWSLDTPRASGPTTLTTTEAQPHGSGDAAAAEWTAVNTTAATTLTELVVSDLPQGQGGRMLHVRTDGTGCGVAQQFLPAGTGPEQVVASVWVRVVRGAVRIGTGNGTDVATTTSGPGGWVLVRAGDGRGPANQLVVAADATGGAEFYLDHAWVRAEDVPSEPVGTPPVRTVTWFAMGPVGPTSAEWTAVDPSAEYWTEDPPLRASVDLSALPADMPRPVLREALRAVRGRTLRTEVYADDGDPVRGRRPYEIHDAAFAVVAVLDGRALTDPFWLTAPVMTVHDVYSREATWDRGAEPMIQVTGTGGHDGYGRPHVTVSLALARGRDPHRPGTPCLGTVAITDFATRDDARLYLLDRIARSARHAVTDTGTGPVLDLVASVLAAPTVGELRGLELTYFDGPAFTGLALGDLGEHGLPVRVEQLVLTPDHQARIAAPVVPGGSSRVVPPYLPADGSPSGAAAWPAEYPAAFRDTIVQAPAERGDHLGYVWHDAAGPVAAGWYTVTSRTAYDVHTPVAGRTPRGLPLVTRDASGADTTMAWDSYDLLPVTTTNAVGLTTTADHDYRVLRPALVTDPNGNRTAIGYTPLGMPAWTARLGKAGRSEGDTVEQPGQRWEYNLTAFDRSSGGDLQPISVSTLRRVEHRWTLVNRENARRAAAGLGPLTSADLAAMFGDAEEADHPERFVRVVEYTDGLGRLLQTRTQADDLAVSDVGLPGDLSAAARTITADPLPASSAVVVSGWRVYDNKGRAIVSFEPFRDTGWAYAPPSAPRLAGLAAVRQHHDPRGRPTVTVAPDGSRTRILRGRPVDPADPRTVVPTPWETWTYDPDDEAGRTHPTESLETAARWNTPSSVVVDALGRTVRTVQRGLAQDLVTTSAYDIDGRLLSVTDPLGRLASATVYDLAGKAWVAWLLDAGTTRMTYDAAGGVLEHRDDKGALVLSAYDRAHRPVAVWARDRDGQAATLRQVTGYGDDPTASGLAPDQATEVNARGRVVLGHDEAGRTRTEVYDLDGNATSTVRRVLKPELLLSQLPAAGAWTGTAYAVDWQPAAGQTVADRAAALLDDTDYAVGATFDALGRRTGTTAPVDATGQRAQVGFTYGRGGGITRVTVDGIPHLQQAVYDPHGRRTLTLLGNGVLVRYGYHPRSLRLRRMRAEHVTAAARGWTSDGPVLQDHTFRHDRMGRLVTLGDRTPGCGLLPTPDRLDRQFRHDALGRLVSATGRETDLPPDRPWLDAPHSTDLTRARAYTEQYTYDAAANLLELRHATDVRGTGAYTRTYTTAPGSNRLTAVQVAAWAAAYSHDAAGNQATEGDNRFFEWDAANRLATFRDQAATATPSVYAQYRYDVGGARVAKIVRRSSGPGEFTVYVGDLERLVRTSPSGVTVHDTLRLNGLGTAAVRIRKGAPQPGDPLADHPVTTDLTDHLGNRTVTLSANAGVLSREEFTPYGETSFGSYAGKRLRFTGQERDEESSLTFHGARYYAPWLARWTSCDPAGHLDAASLYTYVRANPMDLTDPTGRSSYDPAALGDHIDAAIDRGEKAILAEDTGLASSLYNTTIATVATVAKGFTSILRVGTGAAQGWGEITHAQDGWDVAIGVSRILSDAGEVASTAVGVAGTTAKGVTLVKEIRLSGEIRLAAEARATASGKAARDLSERLGELHTDRLANKAGLQPHDCRILSSSGTPTRHGVDRALSGRAPFSKPVTAVVEAKGTGSLPSDPTRLLKTDTAGLVQGSEAYNASRLNRAATSGSQGASKFLQLVNESGSQPASYLVAADASGASSVSRLSGMTGLPTAVPAGGLPRVPTDNILIGIGVMGAAAAGERRQ
ncbi:SpvB/TcaC N-terminal domain-containing protein [Micromonospora chersina]|uniref:SpvB/TcaC N-terminal domain-containing protein n=1 Tax=Micromonospora chersina TaxID=47854 RepID=UPI00370F8918